MKVYLGRAVSGQPGARSLQAIQLAYQALLDVGAEVLCQRVADPGYRAGLDPYTLLAETMRRELVEADAGCLEVTGRSTGVGFEAGWLAARGRPVLMLYDAEEPPGSVVVRHPPFAQCRAYAYGTLTEVGPAVRAFCRGLR